MIKCIKHDCFYYSAKCHKCLNNEPAKIRDAKNVSPQDIRFLKRRGWVK